MPNCLHGECDGRKFCPACGDVVNPTVEPADTSACNDLHGNYEQLDMLFCPHCGKSVRDSS